MKLKKVWTNKNKKNKKYYVYKITLPKAVIEALGWKADKEVKYGMRNNTLELDQ